MSRFPRILPLVGVAAGGVLALNALAGAKGAPDLFSGARAFAQDVTAQAGGKAGTAGAKSPAAKPSEGSPADPTQIAAAAPAPKPLVCAPTAAELAKEAGLSPAELQVLQSLGTRRGQLDQRESDLSTQIALLAAAETKLDAKVKTLNGLKSDIKGLLKVADDQEAAEVGRMVKVFEAMKPKDAAPRMVLLSDSVRLPIAAKLKEKSLALILAQMPPAEAKKLTESLANRFNSVRTAAADSGAAPAPAGATPPAGARAAAPAPAQPGPA
ncbi:MAG: MotE family protein [Phenylobacterium sp.]|jgi:flagellar motility protein MotE (MotC chaperone)